MYIYTLVADAELRYSYPYPCPEKFHEGHTVPICRLNRLYELYIYIERERDICIVVIIIIMLILLL